VTVPNARSTAFIGAIPYIWFYGLRNRWIIAGLALWLAAGVVAKTIKFPVYKRVAALEEDDVVRLRKERKTLNSGNLLQAILNFVAAALMTFAFAG
jgi:large-conductance mechanosensitive channel